jgi:putative ABC transport system permease protein
MSRSEIASAARMALATIREHKMRSFLTVLGVIIGTGTVIAVGSIITGLDKSITDVIRSFGPTTVIAFKFNFGFRNVSREELMRNLSRSTMRTPSRNAAPRAGTSALT